MSDTLEKPEGLKTKSYKIAIQCLFEALHQNLGGDEKQIFFADGGAEKPMLGLGRLAGKEYKLDVGLSAFSSVLDKRIPKDEEPVLHLVVHRNQSKCPNFEHDSREVAEKVTDALGIRISNRIYEPGMRTTPGKAYRCDEDIEWPGVESYGREAKPFCLSVPVKNLRLFAEEAGLHSKITAKLTAYAKEHEMPVVSVNRLVNGIFGSSKGMGRGSS